MSPEGPIPFLMVYGGGDQGGGAEYLVSLLSALDRQRFAPIYVSLGRDTLSQRLGGELACREAGSVRELAGVVRDTGARFLHTHGVRANLLGRLTGRVTRRPVLTTVHSLIAYDYESRLRRSLAVGADNLSLFLSDRFIAVSESVAADLVRRGVPARKISVVYNGVGVSADLPDRATARHALGLAADAAVVGTVARLHAVKGVRYLLQAVARLITAGKTLEVVLVGDGPERGALEREAGELGIMSRVHFLGFRPRAVEVLPALDVFVLPSLMEGMGLAVLEAMAAGLPVAASRVGGLTELVVEGKTGFLVNPADPEALAAAIGQLLAEPERAAGMGQVGRERFLQKFGLDSFARNTEEVYRSLVEGRAGL